MPTTEPTEFNAEEIDSLASLLRNLGSAVHVREFISASLIAAAHRYYSLRRAAETSPTIARVRHDLQRLIDRLQNGTPLPNQLCTEAFNALLGWYPASRYDIFPFDNLVTEQRKPLAFPTEISASHDIISSERANPEFKGQVVLIRQRHNQDSVVDKLIGRDEIGTCNRDIRPTTLEKRLAAFSDPEIADLVVAIRWAISRLEKTAIPRPSNPGRRTVFRWAAGDAEHILIADVIRVLWPDRIPKKVSVVDLAAIVDLVRGKVIAKEDSIGHDDISYALGLRRKISQYETTLERLYADMQILEAKSIRLNTRLVKLEKLETGRDPMTTSRLDRIEWLIAITRKSIKENTRHYNVLDAEYTRLSHDLREIQRRLKFGDYLRPARTTLSRITGKPRRIGDWAGTASL